ncbi:MAG: putative ABC transport system ATP-binding protein [Gammaproteobacteria bacterium]|jgi:putative ABC transport system ATP-binding protein
MIELHKISKTFVLGDQHVKAVNGVDLTVQKGEYISIMGPSGSGKSTLLNLIALLDRPSAGDYWFDGRAVTDLSDDELAAIRRHAIGFIFQSFHLVPRLSARQNVELPLTLAGIEPAVRREKVIQALAATGLSDRAQHRPQELSGGQRQRVAIARAIVMDPPLILADEPTGNLDTTSGGQVVELLERLRVERGVTLIVVTHDADLGGRAHRQIQIIDGSIARDENIAHASD